MCTLFQFFIISTDNLLWIEFSVEEAVHEGISPFDHLFPLKPKAPI